MAEIKDYSVTADDNDSASPAGMPEGMAPSGVNNSWRESFARVKRWYEDIQGAKTTTGSSNAYVLAAARTVAAYAAGDAYMFKANHTCTAAGSTLNVDSVGARSIVTPAGAALGAGDITSGGIYIVAYEASVNKFMLLSGGSSFSGDITAKTADGAILNLQTSDTTVTSGSVLGRTDYQAPDEASGTDAILLAASIAAISEGTFAADNNATKLSFMTAASAAAAETMSLSSGGNLTLPTDGVVIAAGSDSDVTLAHNHDLGMTLSAGTNATQLTISSNNDGASVAPTIALARNSASPAASDQLGHINFVGEDAGSDSTTYAQIFATILDPTGGSEDGDLKFYAITNGTAVAALQLNGTSAVFNGDATIGDDLLLDSDSAVVYFGDSQDVLLSHVADSGLTMSVTGNNVAQFSVSQDSADASTGPIFNLYRYSGSPADNDNGGIIQFYMENDNNQLFTAAQIFSAAVDVTDGTEDGKLVFNTMKAGTATAALTLSELGTGTFGGNIVIPDGGTIGSASDTDSIQIRSDGNVAIGGSASDTIGLNVENNTTGDKVGQFTQSHASNSNNALQVSQAGTGAGLYAQVELGTNSAVFGFHNSSSSVGIGTRGYSKSGYGVYGQSGAAAYAGVIGYSQNASQYAILGYNNTYGVYTTSVTCTGAMSKGSGTFRIPHGLRENYDLCHSFIEGPQCDLIYRGRVDLVNGRATVSMDTKHGMTAGTFAWLTKDVQTFTSNETGWDAVKSSFSGDTITIECQNTSSTDTISWMVVAERNDPNIKESPITDDDGNLIIERPSEPAPPPPED